MKFFHNPKRKGKAGSRRKKRRTAAQRRATAKMIAANRRRRKGTSTKKRRTSTRSVTMARRKRRRVTARRRRPSVRRRSTRRRRSSGTIRFRRVRGQVYSRNPNIINMLTRGVMDAATVVGGKAVSGFIGSRIPQLVPGTLGGVVNRVLSAVVVGFAASRVLSADRARLAVAGALAAPIETAIKAANVPLLSEGLSDDDDGYYEVEGVSGYPGLSGYPAVGAGVAAGMAGDEEEYEYGYAG